MNVNRFISKQPCKMSKNFGVGIVFTLIENKEDLVRLINLYVTNMDELMYKFNEFIRPDLVSRYHDDDEFFIGSEQPMFEIFTSFSGVEVSAESFSQYYVDVADIEFDFDFTEGPYVFATCFDEGFDRFGDVSFNILHYCKLGDLLINKLVI